MLGQGGVNCWGAFSKCSEWEYPLFVLTTHALIAKCCRYPGSATGWLLGSVSIVLLTICVSYNPCVDCLLGVRAEQKEEERRKGKK